MRCLPRVQPKPATKTIGHFDPFDLARRLEVHQAQCKEAYKLHQQRSNRREAAKNLDAETSKVDTTGDFGNAASSQGQERGDPEGNIIATPASVTDPNLMKANRQLEPQVKRSGNPRLPRSKSLPSARKVSISAESFDRGRTLRGPTCLGHDNPNQILHNPAAARPHHPIQKTPSQKRYQTKPQDFRIYTGEMSLGSRPRTVAMNVPDRATCKSDLALKNGIYVPRHAASGLARTTTQGAYERIRVSRQLSRSLPSKCETTPKPLRDIPEHVSQGMSMPSTGTSRRPIPAADNFIRKCNDPKLKPSMEILRLDENSQDREHKPRTVDTTKLHPGSGDGDGLPPLSEEGVERKRQRRTIRARISGMMILNRRTGDEVAAPLLEELPAKPAMSRRKSMLLMFG